MFGWLVVAIPGIPLAAVVARELVSEVVFAVWMRRHDVVVPRSPAPLTAADIPPARGLVIDGELVPAGGC